MRELAERAGVRGQRYAPRRVWRLAAASSRTPASPPLSGSARSSSSRMRASGADRRLDAARTSSMRDGRARGSIWRVRPYHRDRRAIPALPVRGPRGRARLGRREPAPHREPHPLPEPPGGRRARGTPSAITSPVRRRSRRPRAAWLAKRHACHGLPLVERGAPRDPAPPGVVRGAVPGSARVPGSVARGDRTGSRRDERTSIVDPAAAFGTVVGRSSASRRSTEPFPGTAATPMLPKPCACVSAGG